jgi:hypothetical protein
VVFCSATFLRLLETYGFLYRNRKNVFYLERYAPVVLNWSENIGVNNFGSKESKK